MIKNLYISIIAVLLGVSNVNAYNIVLSADSAYETGDYLKASSLYQNAIDEYGPSSDLYLNLGNAFYRSGNQARSILAYERALRLDPSNSDARFNLQFVNERIQDDKGEYGTFISNLIDNIALHYHSNTWAWLGFAFIVLSALGIVLYYFNSLVLLKKIGFFGAIITLVLAVSFILISFKSSTLARDNTYAIITSPTTMLSTVPRVPENRNEEAMLLHEGTKVKILRSITIGSDSLKQVWHEVDIDNRHRAWINNDDIEKIIP